MLRTRQDVKGGKKTPSTAKSKQEKSMQKYLPEFEDEQNGDDQEDPGMQDKSNPRGSKRKSTVTSMVNSKSNQTSPSSCGPTKKQRRSSIEIRDGNEGETSGSRSNQ